jgi:hypothetical protein
MTLGRTPAGAIKIKTDSPKGLRAVECACCNPCDECFTISIPQALRELVANATIDTVTILGYSPDSFVPNYNAGFGFDGWLATFQNESEEVYFFVELVYDRTTGCLAQTYIDYGGSGVAAFGDGQVCQEGTPTQNGTFTVNGEGEYLYYYLTGDPYVAVPPPNLVFT